MTIIFKATLKTQLICEFPKKFYLPYVIKAGVYSDRSGLDTLCGNNANSKQCGQCELFLVNESKLSPISFHILSVIRSIFIISFNHIEKEMKEQIFKSKIQIYSCICNCKST